MKKIILSKVHRSPSPDGEHRGADQEERSSTSRDSDKPPVNPPLPCGPPPPDSPTKLQIKKEIFDDAYADYSEKIPIYDVKCKQEVTPIDPRPMCRRFARGTCTSGSACIFKHELDFDQLCGIYKFCWDFQNKKCTRSACKHVHATVFEEQHYYRTGYLPPSTLAHHNQDITEDLMATSSSNNGAKDFDENRKLHKHSPIFEGAQVDATNKRGWGGYSVGSGHPDIVSSESTKKKCKLCLKKKDSRETANNKMNEKMRTLIRLKNDNEEIAEKTKRLYQIMEAIVTLKSMIPDKDEEKLFEELLESINRKMGMSPGSQSQ